MISTSGSFSRCLVDRSGKKTPSPHPELDYRINFRYMGLCHHLRRKIFTDRRNRTNTTRRPQKLPDNHIYPLLFHNECPSGRRGVATLLN